MEAEAPLPCIDCHRQHCRVEDSHKDYSDQPHADCWIAKPRLQATIELVKAKTSWQGLIYTGSCTHLGQRMQSAVCEK